MSDFQQWRLDQVYNTVAAGGQGGATVAQVAAALEVKVTPMVRDMLKHLEAQGHIVGLLQMVKGARGFRPTIVYYVTKN